MTSADAGYFTEAVVEAPSLASTVLLVPPNRQMHGTTPTQPVAPPGAEASATERMRYRLGAAKGRTLSRMRKAIVEPVFGPIKEARGFRRFLLRALESVRAEFAFVALTHNLLKLFRSAWTLAMA